MQNLNEFGQVILAMNKLFQLDTVQQLASLAGVKSNTLTRAMHEGEDRLSREKVADVWNVYVKLSSPEDLGKETKWRFFNSAGYCPVERQRESVERIRIFLASEKGQQIAETFKDKQALEDRLKELGD